MAGLVILFFGSQIFRLVWFPIAFLIFAVPKYALIDMTTFPLQLLAAKIAAFLGGLAGLDVAREGVNLVLNPGTKGQYNFEVAAACSGMNSLESLLIIGSLFIVYGSSSSSGRKCALATLIVPIAILLNGFRIALTFLLASVFGPKAAEGFFHEWSGIMVYMLEMLCLISAARGLEALPQEWVQKVVGRWSRPFPHSFAASETVSSTNVVHAPLPVLPAVGLFALSALTIWLFSTPEATSTTPPALERVPLTLANWRGEERPKDAPENKVAWEVLQPDAMTAREYKRESGQDVISVLTIVSRSHRSFHVPEYCQLGSGWNPTRKGTTYFSVPTREDASQSRRIPVKMSVVEKSLARNMVLYWYYSGDYATPSMKNLQIYMALSRLFGKQVYGSHVRLTIPLVRSEKETRRLAQEFIRLLMPEIYKVEVAAPQVLSRAQKFAQRLGVLGWLLIAALLATPVLLVAYGVRQHSASVVYDDGIPLTTEAERTPIAIGKD
jgi:EpsI family protein